MRRLIRLEPLYIASLLLALLLWHASAMMPGFRGEPPDYSTLQVAAHLLYLIPFTHYDWLQTVYWTLAYEFAFYLFIGLCFPLIGQPGTHATWIGCAAICLAASRIGLLPERSVLFVIGVTAFHIVVDGQRAVASLVFLIGLLTISVAALWIMEREATAIAGLVTATAIGLGCRVHLDRGIVRCLAALATISYPLYLVHVPVGGRIVNLGQRFLHGVWEDLGLSLTALAVSLLAATILHIFIERPAMKLARSATAHPPR